MNDSNNLDSGLDDLKIHHPALRNETVTEISEVNNVAVVMSSPTYASLVPEEERAEEVLLAEEYKEARNQGLFSTAAGMARLENVLDGNLYAAIRVDENGNRNIEFCQRYCDGSFSPKVVVSQADLRFAAMYQFVPNGITIPRLKTRLGKFLEQVTSDYFGRISGAVVYSPVDILNALVAAIDKLPEFQTNGGGWTPETLYAAIADIINGKGTSPIRPYKEHKSFMVFADFQIDMMAQNLDMKSGKELLKLLDQFNLLYLTKSSKGYQSKVYIDENTRDWAYCIYRAEYLAECLCARG